MSAVDSEPKGPAVPNHFPPFAAVEQRLAVHLARSPDLSAAEQVKIVLRLILDATPIDEQLYVRRYPDVAKAVAEGLFTSPRQHFLSVGYFEGRSAWPADLDEEWYLKAYPDVAKTIASGALKDARQHFNQFGAREGRLPSPVA